MPAPSSRPTPSAPRSRRPRRWSRPTRPRSTTRRRRWATPRSWRRSRAAPGCARSTRATSSTPPTRPASSSSRNCSRSRCGSACRSSRSCASMRPSAKGALAVDVFGNDGVTVIDTGKLTGIDNQVDPTTGTLKLKAEFPNGNYQLWPGQFVNVRLKVETLSKALVVPTSAVQRGPIGTFSYVIGDGQRRLRPSRSTVTQQNETDAVIASGLSPNDRVVTTGFANLSDGSKVIIGSNDQTPSADLAPRKNGSRDRARTARGKDGQAKDGQGRRTGKARTASTAPSGASRARATRRGRLDRPGRRAACRERSEVAMTVRSAVREQAHHHERLRTLHPPADRDLAARHRAPDRRRARLFRAAGLGAAAGRLPDRAGDDAVAGREPRRDRLADHGAAGAAARPDPVAVVDELDELVRRQPDFAAVRSQPRHRRRDPGRAGRDQRRGRRAAANAALSAGLRQGEPGGCAGHDAGADARRRSRCAR